jgi:hypothetical protein
MTGPDQSVSQRDVICRICERRISLETSKTDERGQAVHEECYVREMISRSGVAKAVAPRENWLILARYQLRMRSGITPDDAKEWLG